MGAYGFSKAQRKADEMLYAFGFDRIGVVASDLHFLDPNPGEGQDGAEQGVRLEVRLFERGERHGSIYSAQPIAIGRPIWRADLLESVANPRSLDRAHHHPRCHGWEPGRRYFVEEMSADPIGWVGQRLSDLDGLLEEVGLTPDEVGGSDAAELLTAVPEILAAVRRLLDRARTGGSGQPLEGPTSQGLRVGWL
jgi:hypothetical protein